MASEIKKKLFWRAVVAEFLAMTLFVFISIGSALGFNYPLERNQTLVQDNVKVSLAFGLSIATLAQSVGHISGAHLNPAVTLGLLLSCQISILRAVMYIIAQCVGAIVASAILSGITSSLLENSLGRNDVSGVSQAGVCRRRQRGDWFHLPTHIMGVLNNREKDEGFWGHAEIWGQNSAGLQGLFAGRAESVEELDNNGCQSPLGVSTASNELRGQLVVCQQCPPPGEFLGPCLSYLNIHFSPLQPCPLGNLYLLS